MVMYKSNRNLHQIRYKDLIATEQEFNSDTYGIKGVVDATILVEDGQRNSKVTGLEIKTGRHKRPEHRA